MATQDKNFRVKNGIDAGNTITTTSGDIVAAGILKSNNSATNEGGEIQLALPSSGSTLSTNVVIDVYQNRLRIFESGGTTRGAYIDLSAATAGVGSNLLSGGGGTTTNALTIGTGLSGTSFNGSAAVTIALNSATSTIIGGVYGITTTTSSNTGIGNNALLNNTGTFNTAVGHSAMYINTSGNNNVAVGYAALRSNSAGAENVAIGDSALFTNTASSNTAIGKNALYSNSSGNLNTGIGRSALYTASTAQGNTAIGEASLNLATNGTNTAVGYLSGSTLTTGSNNILIGYNAQPSTVTVSNQITLGDANITTFRIPGLSISASTTALTAPSFVKSGGTSSQYLMADGSVTTGGGGTTTNALTIGTGLSGTSFNGSTPVTIALNSATTTGIGGVRGYTDVSNTSTALGYAALQSGTTSSANVAIGYTTLYTNSTGNSNTAVGYSTMGLNTIGSGNSAIGRFTLYRNLDGNSNNAFGEEALSFVTSGSFNNAFGTSALYNATGSNNTGIGYQSGYALTTGTNNIIVGHQAAFSGTNNLTTGSNNIVIGTTAAASSATVSNEITLGNASIDRFRVPGLGIDWTPSNVPSPTQDIIPLDDLANEFNGIDSRFIPKYQGSQVTISNPYRLLLTINGIIQYIDSPDYVWMSGISRRGFFVDYEGQIQFSEAVPAGSEFDARLMPGAVTTTRTRTYPFKALDILLGG